MTYTISDIISYNAVIGAPEYIHIYIYTFHGGCASRCFVYTVYQIPIYRYIVCWSEEAGLGNSKEIPRVVGIIYYIRKEGSVRKNYSV